MTGIYKCSKGCLALKPHSVVGIGKPLQPIAFVVPIVDGEYARAVGDKMLAFRTKSVGGKLAEAAHVRPAEEARGGLKSLRSVLVHGVVFNFSRRVLQPIMERRPALVRAVEKVRGTGQRLKLHVPSLGKRDFGIDAADAIGSDDAGIVGAGGSRRCVQFTVGVDESDR